MPYCQTCNYWTRPKASVVHNAACPNCGKTFNMPLRPETSVDAASILDTLGLVFVCIALLTRLKPGSNASGVMFLCAGALCLGWAWYRRAKLRAVDQEQTVTAEYSPVRIFERIRHTREHLAQHAQEIQEVLRLEAASPESERKAQRLELLQGALENRQARMRSLDVDLWTREVQLWLNRLEGFLAAELLPSKQMNVSQLSSKFATLVKAAQSLQEQGQAMDLDGVMPQRAYRVLTDCLAKAPELDERVRDARTLAVVGEGAEVPLEFAEGGSWLHWLQEAIPTIELLPMDLTEDDEYLRLKTELRLLRDGVKYGGERPLDNPKGSLDGSPQGGNWEQE